MTGDADASASKWSRAAVAYALAAILALHVAVIVRSAGRALDHDEGEHLRAAAWMAGGRTIYRDFVENHTPLLYELLRPLAPTGSASIDALRRYVTSARLLTGAAGLLAVLCAGAFAAVVARRRVAALAAIVPLLLVGWTSLRAFDDVRSEPYTLLLFWCGALLLVAAPAAGIRGALLLGAGLGAISAAAVWNPKWPAESLVMLAWFCIRALDLARVSKRLALLSVVPAIAIPAVALAVALQATTLRDLTFFGFRYAAALSHWHGTSPLTTLSVPFAFCSPWLRPWFVVPVALVVIWSVRSRRVVLPLMLLLASAVEVRFLYPYPRLWPQYFVMWGCCAAVIYGLLAAQLPHGCAPIVAGVLVVVFFLHDLGFAIRRPDERHWEVKQELNRLLRPGEAAWVRPEEYPLDVPAGSYYWYAFDDQVPFTIEFAQRPEARGFLPALRDEELPPCTLLRAQQTGAPPGYVHVRLIDNRAVRHLPRSAQCLGELWRIGALRRIGATALWEVRPPARR